MDAHTADVHAAQADADRKAFCRLQALAALKGFAVDRIEADDGSTEFCVTRWALTRRCASLGDLVAMLQRMGVEPA